MRGPKAPPGERLQKVLAGRGLGSRREIEGWIQAGQVLVNGRPARLGDRVGPGDRIRVGERDIHLGQRVVPERQVIAYNKPEGELVTRSDPAGRATVFARLPRPRQGRWIAVGRLDINTSGVLWRPGDHDRVRQRYWQPSIRLYYKAPGTAICTIGLPTEGLIGRHVRLWLGHRVESSEGLGVVRWPSRVVVPPGRRFPGGGDPRGLGGLADEHQDVTDRRAVRDEGDDSPIRRADRANERHRFKAGSPGHHLAGSGQVPHSSREVGQGRLVLDNRR
jgi:hypothetical protein